MSEYYGLLNDLQINHLCTAGEETERLPTPWTATQPYGCDAREWQGVPRAMIDPFVDRLVRVNGLGQKVISFGLTSYGYDIRAGREWKVFDPLSHGTVDPKCFDASLLRVVEPSNDGLGEYVTIPANSYALCASVEKFNMPADVIGVAVGKSTYARCGLIVNVTPLEPGWRGHLTIEISNDAPRDSRIYVGEGILQVMFWQGLAPHTTYASRGGKYQDQAGGPVTARL